MLPISITWCALAELKDFFCSLSAYITQRFFPHLSTEIVKTAECKGLVEKLIQTATNLEQFELVSLSRALVAAVKNKHTTNVKELWFNTNIDEALEIALNENDGHLVYNELRLLRAVMNGDSGQVKSVYAEIKQSQISPQMAIAIADSCHHLDESVKDQLLLGTIVKPGHVDWSGLHLTNLKSRVFEDVPAMTRLHLNKNGLKTIPLLECCQMVRCNVSVCIVAQSCTLSVNRGNVALPLGEKKISKNHR